ncbi:MAG: class I SAM-dependent methyltransferase [Acidimicrobiia bacterium]|nr:class I SAM-dependent methyltransferase [Acidimicrobiia bacterium]NNF87477.1 rhamnosyl O-methyltransferase [Acidimicrobiia bacterium]
MAHWWRTLRTHRLVLVPKPPGPYVRAEVIGSQDPAPTDYHLWYYRTGVWKSTSWLGVRTLKSVSDMWNYQEILTELRPRLVVEFGTAYGGSALFFASVLDGMGLDYRVLTVDTLRSRIDEQTIDHPRIDVLTASSTEPATAEHIDEVKDRFPGPVFAILDSDHAADHVRAELELITPLLMPGDYLVVEDSNLNGHPVMPDYGPGPFEAVEAFLADHPGAYRLDTSREAKFGFSFAPGGFLIRQ